MPRSVAPKASLVMATKEQLIVTDMTISAGAISYWRVASDTNLTTLAAAWEKHGLDAAQLPTPPKDEVALGRAVNSLTEKRRLVRPLARRGAWAIVDETVVEGQAPKYSTRVIVRFAEGQVDVEIEDAAYSEMTDLRSKIDVAYASARNTLAHHDVSSWLLDIAYSKLGAVSLRDSGGVYFIPRMNVEAWNKIANALEEAGSTIFRIPAMRTAEAVAAITDAITAEAADMAQKIEDELLKTGEEALGKRALNTRVKESMALLEKLSTYEELIGKQLDVRKRVELLSANITSLALSEPETA